MIYTTICYTDKAEIVLLPRKISQVVGVKMAGEMRNTDILKIRL